MYYFAIREYRWYSFSVLDNNEWTTLIDWTENSAIRHGEVNRLTVLAEGSHFVFFINDQYVGEADDSRLSRGRAGVAIELYNAGDKATFEFDNFKLLAP